MTIGNETEGACERSVLLGALGWCVFCCVAVALRGVRWDENYEFAQVILGLVPYAEGHPLFQYTYRFFSLQTYELAALMWLAPGPLIANALRNVVFLMATVLPIYLLCTHFTRQARWGHAGALLVLMGIHLPFFSNYPAQVWPEIYSNGHIGMGYMLITLWALLERRYRLAGFLAGLAPAVHLGQFPPLLGLAFLYGLVAWRGGGRQNVRTLIIYCVPGLVFCVIFWIFLQWFSVAPPESGPYFSAIAPQDVWRGYMTHHASHRSLPLGTGHIVMVGLPLLALASFSARKTSKAIETNDLRSTYGWLGVYGLIVAVVVWGIMFVQYRVGENIPYLLISWLPYRLMNHAPPLLIPLILSLYARGDGRSAVWLVVAGALGYGIAQPLLALGVPETFYERYLATGEDLFFVLYGGAAYLACRSVSDGKMRSLWIAAFVLAFVVLVVKHQFGAACCLVGAGLVALLQRWELPAKCLRPTLACVSAVLAVFLLLQQGSARSHLPVSPFEASVRDYLSVEGEEDAMIWVRHQQEGLQARLHHPVMTDMASMNLIPYIPSIGPTIYKLYRAAYGINFAPTPGEKAYDGAWHEVWPAKTRQEWEVLGEEYRAWYVLAPSFMQLDLPRVVEGKSNHLYRIPH